MLPRLACGNLIALYHYGHRAGEEEINVVVLSPLGDEFVPLRVFHEFAVLDESICELRIAADKLLALECINKILAAVFFKSLFHLKVLLQMFILGKILRPRGPSTLSVRLLLYL